MIKTIYLTCIYLLVLGITVTAQVSRITSLHSNAVIKDYLRSHPQTKPSSNARTTQSGIDTIPFIDDFSYDGIYPNQNLWSDSDVFINRDFPINPPTIGVATFDGLDKYGNPYYSNENLDSTADHLTSNYINLNYPGDTTIWLSFFYQPQGNGTMPLPQDSLEVEFENPFNFDSGMVSTSGDTVTLASGDQFITDGSWNGVSILIDSISYQIVSVTSTNRLILLTSAGTLTNVRYSITYGTWNVVWSVPGREDTVFQQVMINIRDTAVSYLNGNFRFRFTNIANLGGASDQWNIDYVRLDKDRSASDTAIVHDGAFLYRNKPLLAPPFTSMPYTHYAVNPVLFTSTGDSVQYKNLTGAPAINLTKEFRITIDDTIYRSDSATALLAGVPPYSTVTYFQQFYPDYALPVTTAPSLEYTTWNIQTIPDANPQNDTVRETDVLSNYYSYDDGTAEAAYGVFPPNDLGEADLALRFDLKMPDTLRGVQIFWDQFPSPYNAHNLLLNIAVWNQLTPGTNNDNLIYQLVDTSPANDSTINGFYTYTFDSVLIVSGTIYVGWRQFYEQDFLNVGFDKNTDTHNLLYLNAAGIWEQAADPGTVMIRPIFGGPITTLEGMNEIKKMNFTATVFPNPASNFIHIAINAKQPSSYSFELFDEIGNLAAVQKQSEMNVSDLANGLYMLKITDDKTSQFETHKILIAH